MDFRLRTNVDAARRFVHNKDVALAGEPFGKGEFLLIAAAEAGDEGLERWSLHSQTVGVTMNERLLFAPAHTAEAGQPIQRRQRGIFAAVQREHQAEPLAVFREEAN